MKVERSIVVPAPPGAVWEALVKPERLATWLGADVELDARPGGRVVVADEDGERFGTVEVCEPGQLLVLRLWQPAQRLSGSRLEFVLDAEGEHTRVTVVESQLMMRDGRELAMGRHG
jgi:uncharacterized protein YndB with AHSA1/START domain